MKFKENYSDVTKQLNENYDNRTGGVDWFRNFEEN